MSGGGPTSNVSRDAPAAPHPDRARPNNQSSHQGFALARMERLWSRAVTTSGNRWQMRRARKPQNQAKTVAAGCDRLPRGAHGKEGVDGSSPSEGLRQKPCKWGCSVACGGIPSASRVRAGYTFGHWRAFADTRDLWRRLARRSVPAMELRDPRISLHAGTIRCGVGQEHEPLPPERVSRPGRCRFRAGQALDRYSRPARVALRRGSAAAVAVNG